MTCIYLPINHSMSWLILVVSDNFVFLLPRDTDSRGQELVAVGIKGCHLGRHGTFHLVLHCFVTETESR